MTTKRIAPLLIAAVALAASAEAARWVVPAAAHAAGAVGTNWRTDLRIGNPTGSPLSASVTLLPANRDNSALAGTVSVDVPAFGQTELPDVVSLTFRGDGSGALLVEANESRVVVTSRTYNALEDGSSFGQFVPGIAVERALVGGETGHIVYLSKSADYRSNLGWAGTSSASGEVTVKLFGADGAALGSPASFPVLPYGQRQLNDVFAATGAPAADVARAEISATVPVVAYSSVIDNRTGDPIAVVAQHAGELAHEFGIAAAAHAPGNGGAVWRSDVRIWNASTRSSTVLLTFRPRGGDASTEISKNVSLAANELRSFDDVVGTLFNLDNAAGSIRIRAFHPVFVVSRTYNLSATGTFGQDIPAVPLEQGMAAGDTAMFTGVSDVGYRTNIGFLNLGTVAIDVEVSLASGSGAVRPHSVVRLAPGESQQTDAFGLLGVSGIASGAIRITSSTLGAWYTAYVSVIDSRSNDAVLVPAAVDRGSTSAACVDMPIPATGTVAKYSVVGKTSYGVGTGTQTIRTVSASNTRTVDRTQLDFSAGGLTAVSDTTSTIDYTILTSPAGFVSLHRLEITGTASITGVPGSIPIHTTTTFSPDWVHGPGTRFCTGMFWVMPIAQQTTLVEVGGQTQTTTTPLPAGNGEVVSVSETVTTPAGTFDTVHLYRNYFGESDSATPADVWIDKASGVWVRQYSYDAAGVLETEFNLTELTR